MYSIGVDIGGTNTKFLVLDEAGNIFKSWSINTDTQDSGSNILRDIYKEIEMFMLNRNMSSEMFSVIGLGVPGPVDSIKGVVTVAVNLGWGSTNPKKWLEDRLNIEVYVLNDANAAAIGEKTKLRPDVQNVLFVTLGTGVGGGIILKNEILIGPNFAAGEIGHIPIASDEQRICGCGNTNCLETYASANGLSKTIKRYKEINASKLVDVSSNKLFFEEVKNRNCDAVNLLNDYCEKLAIGLAGIVNTLDVEVVIIGGGLSNAGEYLIKPLEKKMNEKLFNDHKKRLKIKLAQLGNDAGAIGAVHYGLKRKEENK